MENETVHSKQETEFTGEENTEDEEKKMPKKKGGENVKSKHKSYLKDVSLQKSSSSYTTAEEDQGQWTPDIGSSAKCDSIFVRYQKLEKLYKDKCTEATLLKNELDDLKDISCIDASMGQLTSEMGPDKEQVTEYERMVYRDTLEEQDKMIKDLADALKEETARHDLSEKANENLLQKIQYLEQELSKVSAYVQHMPSDKTTSSETSKALMDEILQLKQDLAHKDLLCQEACTKQFSLEAELRELEERSRQQYIEYQSALLHSRRARIKEESNQVETLLENIGCANDDEDSGHIHLWEEVMSAREEAHQLIVEKLEIRHQEQLTERENAVRLETMAKIKNIEEKHFKQISEISEQLQNKLDASNAAMKQCVLQHLDAHDNLQQSTGVPSLEGILLCLDEKTDLRQEIEPQIKALLSHNVEVAVRTLEEQHYLNLKRQLANVDLVQQQELTALRSSLEYEKQLQIGLIREELTKRHKDEINEMLRLIKSEQSRLQFYVATGGSGMLLLKKQFCAEYKAAFQALVSSWMGEWKQEMASISARLDALADAPQTNRDSDLSESLQLGLEGTDSLLGEQERLLNEAKDISQRLIQHFKSSLGEMSKALELEHSRVTERIEEMRSELEEAGVAARLQALVERLRTEKHELENNHKLALENIAARHESEVTRLRRLVQDVQAGGENDALKAQQLELEQRHHQELEELRSYFEQKCADVGKHYSEEIYSQHSRKMSDSNCSSECELGSEIYYTGPGAGVGMMSHCGSSSAADSAREGQHGHESCLDRHCKEREERIIKEFQERLEAQRLTLESRYLGELETLKEEYEIGVKELARDITRSHQAELASREAQFEDEKNSLTEKFADADASGSKYRLEAESLKGTVISLTEKAGELQTKYQDVLSKVEALKEELAKLEIENNSLTEKLAEADARRSQSRLEAETLKETISTKYQDALSEAEALKKQLAKLEIENNSLTEKLAEADATRSQSRFEVETLKETISSLTGKADELQTKYQDALSEAEALKEQLAKLEIENNSLTGKLAKADATISSALLETETLKEAISSLTEKADKLQTKYEDALAEAEALKEQLTKFKIENNSLTGKIEALLETEALKATMPLLTEKANELQTKYQHALSEVESLREQLAKLEDVSCHEVSREIETTTEEWIDSLEIITEPKGKAGVRWGKIVKSDEESCDSQVEKSEEVASLKKGLNAAQELEEKCAKLTERVVELEQKLVFAHDEKDHFINKSEKLDMACSEMEELNEDLKKKCLDWEKEYLDLKKHFENIKRQRDSANLELEDMKKNLSSRFTDLTEVESVWKNDLCEMRERLKLSEEKQTNLSGQLNEMRSEKENFVAEVRRDVQQQLQQQHQAEIARLKKYYDELQSRTAEGQEDGGSSPSSHLEERKLREDLNGALQREREARLECRELNLSLQKKQAELERLSEAVRRKETESAHQIALLKSKLRESHETIAGYDKCSVPPKQIHSRVQVSAVIQAQLSEDSTKAYLDMLLTQLEAAYAEYFKLVQQCSDESQVDIAAKYVRALEELQQQHEGELVRLDLPVAQTRSKSDKRRLSVSLSLSGSGHVADGDNDSSKSFLVPTLEGMLMDNGTFEKFSDENVRVIRRISEELEALHVSQFERLQASYVEQLEAALSLKEKEFDRLESELRLEQEVQLKEVQQDAERRWNLRLEEARKDIVHTLETSVQALLTGDCDAGERPLELQKLEEKLSAKYRRELEVQKENHAAEIQKLKQQYDSRILRKGSKNAAALSERLAVITSERDCLRNVAATLRDLVVELVRYFVSCEDKMNTTLMEELALFGQDCSILRNSRSSDTSGETDDGNVTGVSMSLVPMTPGSKRVRFADELSGVVKYIGDESLLRLVDVSQTEASMELEQEIERCLGKLRLEAQALLALSQQQISDAEKSGARAALLASPHAHRADESLMEQKHAEESECSLQNVRLDSCEGSADLVFEEFGDNDPVTYLRHASTSPRGKVLDQLIKKARALLPDVSQTSLFLEELRRDWERLMEDSRRQEENLQQQVKAADKQLRETRSFLEEQVAEREQERDEIQRLREVVREKERERSSLGHMSKESQRAGEIRADVQLAVESLNAQLQDNLEALKDAEKKITDLEAEREKALDKIRNKDENINDLEGQLLKKMQQEASLEMRIKMLQKLTEQQGKTHLELVQEFENLHKETDMTEHVRRLEEKLQQYEMVVEEGNLLQSLKEMRSQLSDMELLVGCRTKMLENASATAGSPALSSPSEDVSIRETVLAMRNIMRAEHEEKTPDKVPVLPLDAVARLEDKIQRHVRAEEALLKKITDLDLQFANMRSNLTEIQAERDHLSERLQEQLLQTSQLQVRLEEQRHKGDVNQKQALAGVKERLSEAQAEIATLREDLESRHKECDVLQSNLDNAHSALQKKDREVAQISESHQYLIEQLKIQIKKHLKEKEKLKEVFSSKMNASASLPLLVDSVLADKNADIDMLRSQVAHFKNLSQVRSPYDSSLQQSEYSATPSSTLEFEYRETEKVRAHVELSPILELRRSINISELEPQLTASPTGKKADDRLQETLNVQTTLPRLVSPNIQPKCIEPQVEPPPREDSMVDSITVEGSDPDHSESSPGDQEDSSDSLVHELKTTVANLTNDNNSLKDELSVKDSEVKQLTDQVRASQEILANLQSKLEEAREMASRSLTQELAKENSELKERFVSIRAELEDNFKQRENELRRLLEAEQTAARAAHQELEDERHQLAEARSGIEAQAALQQRVKNAEEENSRLKTELENLQRLIADSKEKSLTEKLENEKEFSKALKEELNMCRVRIRELETDLEKLEIERAAKIQEGLSRLDELKRAQEQLEFLLGENAKLDAELVVLKSQQKQEQDDSSRSEYLIQEIAHLRHENVEVGRELSEMKKNVNKIRQGEALRATQEHKDLRHLLRDNSKLKKELASLRKAIEGVYGGDGGAPSPDASAAGLSSEDKALILSLRNKMDCLAVKLDNPRREAALAKKRARLTRTAVMTNDFVPPGSPLTESESLEDLTGLVRRELHVSAHLDDTLLQSLQPLSTRDKISQPCGSQLRNNVDPSPISSCYSTVDVVDKKNGQLLQAMQQLKTSNVALSSELSETRCTVQLLQSQLEIERSRYKTLQEQDSTLIETMRIKLEQALDSEVQLRIAFESERRQRLEAANHVRIEAANHMGAGAGAGDARLASQQQHSERFHDAETCRLNVEKQTKFLEAQLSKALRELEQRRATQDVLLEKAREAELRRSRKRAAEEEQHRNRLDHANMCQEELQKELEDTRRQLHQSRSLEADLRRELAEIRNSQLQDHRRILQELEVDQMESFVQNMDKHVAEKKHLTDQIKLLLEERSQLQTRINQLEEEVASRLGNDNWGEIARLSNERACWERERIALHAALTQATKKQCTHDPDFEERVNYLFGKYLRCDSYRKALVWQKRYLLLVVNSYHEVRSQFVLDSNYDMPLPCPRLLSPYPRERSSGQRRGGEMRPIERFRVAALVVKAIARMRFMVQRWCRSRRIGSNVVLSKNFVQAPTDAGSDSSVRTVWRHRGSVGMSGDGVATGSVVHPSLERAGTQSSGRLTVLHRSAYPWSSEMSSADCQSRLHLAQQRLEAHLAHTPRL